MPPPEVTIAATTGALMPPPGSAPPPGPPTADQIRAGLSSLRWAGFTAIELSDIWVNSATMEDPEVDQLGQEIRDHGLAVVGLSTLGLGGAARALSVAARLGAATLCLGLHRLGANRGPHTSFWANPPLTLPDDEDEMLATSVALKDLCACAADSGLQVVIEMNENSLIDRASRVLKLLDMTGADNLGVNPDLGNLTRVTVPMVEPWYETLLAVASRTTYWHVKNNLRLEHPSGFVATHPSQLEDGFIDYRFALNCLLDAGFTGPVVIESYWGDRLRFLQRARCYLEETVRQVIDVG